MVRVHRQPEKLVCVRHRRGWCVTWRKTTGYRAHIRTVCGNVVTLPYDIQYESGSVSPDCQECLNRLGEDEED